MTLEDAAFWARILTAAVQLATLVVLVCAERSVRRFVDACDENERKARGR